MQNPQAQVRPWGSTKGVFLPLAQGQIPETSLGARPAWRGLGVVPETLKGGPGVAGRPSLSCWQAAA